MKIEWDCDFVDGRRRRRPLASAVHGWLTKWRGTFLGDERMRSRGIREMKEARATRKHKQEQIKASQGLLRKASKNPQAKGTVSRSSSHRHRSKSTRRTDTVRPNLTRKGTTSSSRRATADRPKPHRGASSRQQSYRSHTSARSGQRR